MKLLAKELLQFFSRCCESVASASSRKATKNLAKLFGCGRFDKKTFSSQSLAFCRSLSSSEDVSISTGILLKEGWCSDESDVKQYETIAQIEGLLEKCASSNDAQNTKPAP